MAIYLRRSLPVKTPAGPPPSGPSSLEIALPDGGWQAEWVDTTTGTVVKQERVTGGGTRTLVSPAYDDDIALRLTAGIQPPENHVK
jgi:hypothetical protein